MNLRKYNWPSLTVQIYEHWDCSVVPKLHFNVWIFLTIFSWCFHFLSSPAVPHKIQLATHDSSNMWNVVGKLASIVSNRVFQQFRWLAVFSFLFLICTVKILRIWKKRISIAITYFITVFAITVCYY